MDKIIQSKVAHALMNKILLRHASFSLPKAKGRHEKQLVFCENKERKMKSFMESSGRRLIMEKEALKTFQTKRCEDSLD